MKKNRSRKNIFHILLFFPKEIKTAKFEILTLAVYIIYLKESVKGVYLHL